jgi:hypothetical protein
MDFGIYEILNDKNVVQIGPLMAEEGRFDSMEMADIRIQELELKHPNRKFTVRELTSYVG